MESEAAGSEAEPTTISLRGRRVRPFRVSETLIDPDPFAPPLPPGRTCAIEPQITRRYAIPEAPAGRAWVQVQAPRFTGSQVIVDALANGLEPRAEVEARILESIWEERFKPPLSYNFNPKVSIAGGAVTVRAAAGEHEIVHRLLRDLVWSAISPRVWLLARELAHMLVSGTTEERAWAQNELVVGGVELREAAALASTSATLAPSGSDMGASTQDRPGRLRYEVHALTDLGTGLEGRLRPVHVGGVGTVRGISHSTVESWPSEFADRFLAASVAESGIEREEKVVGVATEGVPVSLHLGHAGVLHLQARGFEPGQAFQVAIAVRHRAADGLVYFPRQSIHAKHGEWLFVYPGDHSRRSQGAPGRTLLLIGLRVAQPLDRE